MSKKLVRWLALGSAATLLAACSGNGSGTGANGGGKTLEIAVFSPFSGANADYGFFEYAGCPPAVNLINAAGGVLGNKLTCKIVDNRGEPADAVPAAQQMLATSPNLVAIIDGDSGLLSSTVPLFERARITDLSAGGDVQFDKNTYKYFWRTIPGDDVAGYALAAWAKKQGWTRIAAVFANDQAAQGNVPGLLDGAKNLGIQVVSNQAVALDHTSYATEIQKLMASSPQAIMMEADPQTGGVFVGQLKQAGGLVPIVGSSGTLGVDWNKSVTAGIGAADFTKYFKILTTYAPSSGPAWETFNKALLAAGSEVKDPAQYADQVYAEVPYDNVNLIALAMLAANSTKPSAYNSFIRKVADGGADAVVVHNFADGKAALSTGKKIKYVGVTGAIQFDQYQNSPGTFAAAIPGDHNAIAGILTPAEIEAARGN
jgi:branched-chain amino acid transport system substrate-binding protein